jgi:hypothetical protein
VQKVSERMRCCFCGTDTAEAPAENYVEIEITFPVFDGPMRQFFGAHVGCFNEATAVGFAIEKPH